MIGDNGETSYLVVVEYEDDAERKRAEYLLDNWDDGDTEPISGLSRLVSDVDIDELYQELVSKVPERQISTYELTPVNAQATQQTVRFEYTFDTDTERVEWAMEALMNKRKSVTEDEGENVYGIYTKKGRATIEYDITDLSTDEVQLTGKITGYGDAPEFLREFIKDELEYMV